MPIVSGAGSTYFRRITVENLTLPFVAEPEQPNVGAHSFYEALRVRLNGVFLALRRVLHTPL
jgi:hypothetical protein